VEAERRREAEGKRGKDTLFAFFSLHPSLFYRRKPRTTFSVTQRCSQEMAVKYEKSQLKEGYKTEGRELPFHIDKDTGLAVSDVKDPHWGTALAAQRKGESLESFKAKYEYLYRKQIESEPGVAALSDLTRGQMEALGMDYPEDWAGYTDSHTAGRRVAERLSATKPQQQQTGLIHPMAAGALVTPELQEVAVRKTDTIYEISHPGGAVERYPITRPGYIWVGGTELSILELEAQRTGRVILVPDDRPRIELITMHPGFRESQAWRGGTMAEQSPSLRELDESSLLTYVPVERAAPPTRETVAPVVEPEPDVKLHLIRAEEVPKNEYVTEKPPPQDMVEGIQSSARKVILGMREGSVFSPSKLSPMAEERARAALEREGIQAPAPLSPEESLKEVASGAAWVSSGAVMGAFETGVVPVYRFVTKPVESSSQLLRAAGEVVMDPVGAGGKLIEYEVKKTSEYGPLYPLGQYAGIKMQQTVIGKALGTAKHIIKEHGMWLDPRYPFKVTKTWANVKVKALKLRVEETLGRHKEGINLPKAMRDELRKREGILKGSRSWEVQHGEMWRSGHVKGDYDILIKNLQGQHGLPERLAGKKVQWLEAERFPGTKVREIQDIQVQAGSQWLQRNVEMLRESKEAYRWIGPASYEVYGSSWDDFLRYAEKHPDVWGALEFRKTYVQTAEVMGGVPESTSLLREAYTTAYDIIAKEGRVFAQLKPGLKPPGWWIKPAKDIAKAVAKLEEPAAYGALPYYGAIGEVAPPLVPPPETYDYSPPPRVEGYYLPSDELLQGAPSPYVSDEMGLQEYVPSPLPEEPYVISPEPEAPYVPEPSPRSEYVPSPLPEEPYVISPEPEAPYVPPLSTPDLWVPPPPPLEFPSFEEEVPETNRDFSLKLFGKETEYKPSLTAEVFGITAPEPPPAPYTGLEIRPVVVENMAPLQSGVRPPWESEEG
jgi:hypothetical protein